MQIRIASVMVENQDTALRFYTTILGFVKNKDIPMGPTFRWLTVSAPEGAEGVELVLEPMAFPPAQTYQKALFAAGIPSTAFITNDIQSEYRRLKSIGVTFRGEPTPMGPITAVLFEGTCGTTSSTWSNPSSNSAVRPNAKINSATVPSCTDGI